MVVRLNVAGSRLQVQGQMAAAQASDLVNVASVPLAVYENMHGSNLTQISNFANILNGGAFSSKAKRTPVEPWAGAMPYLSDCLGQSDGEAVYRQLVQNDPYTAMQNLHAGKVVREYSPPSPPDPKAVHRNRTAALVAQADREKNFDKWAAIMRDDLALDIAEGKRRLDEYNQ